MFQYVQSRKRTKIEYEEEDDVVCKENPVPSKHGHPSWEMKLNHQVWVGPAHWVAELRWL